MRLLVIFLLISSSLFAIKPMALQFTGFDVEHIFSNKEKKKFRIERVIDEKCLDISVSTESFDKKNIKYNIDNRCKKSFITTTGVIQPLYINESVKTFSEVEVMHFIFAKASIEKDKYILVDSRKASWFDNETIPSAVNIPFEDLKYDEDFQEDYKKAYENLGVKTIQKDKYDFTNAKTAVFFCNGSWCPLSSKSIKHLLSIGYPSEKLIWYRGGIQSWKALNLTTTKN